MPAYRQLGNRVSWQIDVKVEKKIRIFRKNFCPTIKLQQTQAHQGNFARSDFPLKLGKCWSFNFPAFPTSLPSPKPIKHRDRVQSDGTGNLGRSSANCSIPDLPSFEPDRADEEKESPEPPQSSLTGR